MSNSQLFNPILPFGWLLAVATTLLIYFGWLEWKRNVRFLYARLIAVLFLILSIVGIATRPSYLFSNQQESFLLLTNQYDQKLADSLKEATTNKFIQLPGTTLYPEALQLKSIYEIEEYSSRIRGVLGEGIPLSILRSHSDWHFTFFPTKNNPGITALQIPELKVNQLSYVTGEINASNEGILVLQSPGGNIDSVTYQPGKQYFSLKLKPTLSGKFLYQLIQKENNAILHVEDLPLLVRPARKLQIMFMQTFPTFETRYLKNYLAENGHSVSLRYKVSHNTLRFETINGLERTFQKVTADLLSSFDLLIITPEVANSLTAQEKEAVTQQVEEGMGALLLFQQADAMPPPFSSLLKTRLLQQYKDTTSIRFTATTRPLTIDALPMRVIHSKEVTSLWNDVEGTLAGYTRFGLGHIGFQFIQNTYLLALAGNQNDYANLWAPLLEKISRKKENTYELTFDDQLLNTVDEPLTFGVVSYSDIPVLKMDTDVIPLFENPYIENKWDGIVWPDKQGWHSFTFQDSSQYDVYVQSRSGWRSLKLAQQLQENKFFESKNTSASEATIDNKEIPRTIFFVVFLLAAGFLWLAPKL